MGYDKANKTNFLKWVLKHIKGITWWGLIIIIFFPFVSCITLKKLSVIPGTHFVITEEINSWFSFWGSYSGAIVSAIIGIITLHLTLFFERIGDENEKLKKNMSIAKNMPNMECKHVKIYSLEEGDFAFKYLRLFNEKRSYILTFNMEPAFPQYFEVKITSIKICLKNLRHGQREESESIPISKESLDYEITNNNKFEAVINIPESLKCYMRKAYVMNSATTEGIDYSRLIIDVWLGFKCRNVLIEGNYGDVQFDMHLKLKNIGTENGYGKVLEVVDRQFERVLNDKEERSEQK